MSLAHFDAVKSGRVPPRFVATRAQFIAAPSLAEANAAQLWEAHATRPATAATVSLIDLKLELARRNLQSCTLCAANCRVDRWTAPAGACHLPAELRVFRANLNYAEELPLVPTLQFWYTGCNFRCPYCSVLPHVLDPKCGAPFDQETGNEQVRAAAGQGATSISFVGGEPTVNLYGILGFLRELDCPLAVVWNTNLYASEEAMHLLDGIVDLYVADCRAGNPACARDLGAFEDAMDVTFRNLRLVNGASMILRHLLLPGHVECCLLPIARRVASELPEIDFHPLLNYTPYHAARQDSQLRQILSPQERRRAREIVQDLHLNLIE